jgi:LPXTG-site transpeptidase (sortase) family protein
MTSITGDRRWARPGLVAVAVIALLGSSVAADRSRALSEQGAVIAAPVHVAPVIRTASQERVPQPLARSAPTRVRVPALGISAPIIPLGLTKDRALDVPTRPQDAGWWTGGATPGELGPAVIAAHVRWKGKAGAFQNLSKAKVGQRITVRRADGRTVTFVVTRVAQYRKDQFPTLAIYGPTSRPELRLITCARLNVSGRGYRDNIIVFARML